MWALVKPLKPFISCDYGVYAICIICNQNKVASIFPFLFFLLSFVRGNNFRRYLSNACKLLRS